VAACQPSRNSLKIPSLFITDSETVLIKAHGRHKKRNQTNCAHYPREKIAIFQRVQPLQCEELSTGTRPLFGHFIREWRLIGS
jgi:hypothetical protein